jgi:hypothetical protein
MANFYTPPKFGEKNPFEIAMERVMRKRTIQLDDKDAVKKRLVMNEGSTVEIPDTHVWRADDKPVDDDEKPSEGVGDSPDNPLVIADEAPSTSGDGRDTEESMEIDTR